MDDDSISRGAAQRVGSRRWPWDKGQHSPFSRGWSFSIQEMVEEDVPMVIKIIRRTMGKEDASHAKRTFTAYFKSKEKSLSGKYSFGEYYVAMIDGKVAGMSGFYHYKSSHWLGWFAVDPKYQGNGIGSALLERVETSVRNEGGKKLLVWTSSLPRFNRAKEFYKRKGFKEESGEKYPGHEEDDLFFSKKL